MNIILLSSGSGKRLWPLSNDVRSKQFINVIAGTGKTLVDGMEQPIKPGDVITMAAGYKHTVIAGDEGLQLIEVQLGSEISVADKKKYEM